MGKDNSMGVWSAAAIGLGAMIGAGIFALIGIAVKITGTFAFISFGISGIIALLVAYSISKLAVEYPSKAGRVKFLHKGLGEGVTSGGLNVIMWIGYIVVTSLYARAFSEYAYTLFPPGASDYWHYILASGIVVTFAVINFIGAKAVGNVELGIVLIKIFILVGFALVGIAFVEPQNFTLSQKTSFQNVMVTSGIVFLSYEGLGLVANTAEDLKKPKENLSKAIYISVILAVIIYVLVSVVVIGTLTDHQIIASKEYVLAKAVEPMFGSAGFTVMVAAALFSTASAINATIYGPVYMVHETAKSGQLPKILQKSYLGRESGMALIITTAFILFFANVLDLSAIAELGSISFLVIYISVNIAHLKLTDKTGARRSIIWAATIGCGFVLSMLVYYALNHNLLIIIIFLIVIVSSFIFEYFYLNYNDSD